MRTRTDQNEPNMRGCESSLEYSNLSALGEFGNQQDDERREKLLMYGYLS